MRIAIQTDNWSVATKHSITTEEGLNELEQASLIMTKLGANIRLYLEEIEHKKGTESD